MDRSNCHHAPYGELITRRALLSYSATTMGGAAQTVPAGTGGSGQDAVPVYFLVECTAEAQQ
jgi:hypothetical protein